MDNLQYLDKGILIRGQDSIQLSSEKCPVCKGKGTIELLGTQCPFCNGSGEHTKSAESYLKTHICQCIFLDRKTCPVCGKRCHHDTPNKPKILVGPV